MNGTLSVAPETGPTCLTTKAPRSRFSWWTLRFHQIPLMDAWRPLEQLLQSFVALLHWGVCLNQHNLVVHLISCTIYRICELYEFSFLQQHFLLMHLLESCLCEKSPLAESISSMASSVKTDDKVSKFACLRLNWSSKTIHTPVTRSLFLLSLHSSASALCC